MGSESSARVGFAKWGQSQVPELVLVSLCVFAESLTLALDSDPGFAGID